jgi:hypothetical protein
MLIFFARQRDVETLTYKGARFKTAPTLVLLRFKLGCVLFIVGSCRVAIQLLNQLAVLVGEGDLYLPSTSWSLSSISVSSW